MASEGFFHRYFYGSASRHDYTEADMPKNRRELFFTVLRDHVGGLAGLNLLYLLIWLPTLAWTLLNLLQTVELAASYEGAALVEQLQGLMTTWSVFLFPLIAITGPFTGGIAHVLRRWARDEHCDALSGFREGLRENWRQALGASAISGAVPGLLWICLRFYSAMLASSPFFYLPLALSILIADAWVLAAQLIYTLMDGYRLKFSGLCRNALILTLSALPKVLGVRLLTLLAPLAGFLIYSFAPGALSYAIPVLLLYFALIGLSLHKLLQASLANALCEKLINPKIVGAKSDIGLRPKEREERK